MTDTLWSPTAARIEGSALEVPIKKLLSGRPLENAANLASVDDPDALRWYARFAANRSG